MLSTTKTILKNNELWPSKKLGQNFLINKASINKVLSAAKLKANDIVLEIGSGLGALTIEIAKQVKQVIAVEKDTRLFTLLNEKIKQNGIKNIKLINEDILKFKNLDRLFLTAVKNSRSYKVVGNLPYNIATAVIMKFLESANPPSLMVVMLQKEVGQRMVAKPPKMSKLAVFSQFYSTVKIVGYVSKNSFYPRPKVDSAILLLNPKTGHGEICQGRALANFTKIVGAGFAHPRKQLINNLSLISEDGRPSVFADREIIKKWLIKNKIRPEQRAETLTVNNWINLTQTYLTFFSK